MNCQVLVNATGLEPVITSLKGRSLIPFWPCVHVEDRTRIELVIPRGKRFADVCLAIRPTVHILGGLSRDRTYDIHLKRVLLLPAEL